MRRGTTPTINLIFQNSEGSPVDLTSFTVYLTIDDGKGHKTDFTNDRITFNEDLSMDITLTQEETLTFKGTTLYAQVRAVDSEGLAIASDVVSTALEDILKDGVIWAD